MIQKTNNYEQFTFSDDNRSKIRQKHVERIADSIKARNLLEFRPVLVNKNMQILDGQHRVLAAKKLGVEIYYQVQEDIKLGDVILLNTSASWTNEDYLNYYVKNGYEEYIKLNEFIKKHDVTLKVVLNTSFGKSRQGHVNFKTGSFKFDEESIGTELDNCWETVSIIKQKNGSTKSLYTSSTRFWTAMIKLFTHEQFDRKKWMTNLKKLSNRFEMKASIDEYVDIFLNIYNWRNNKKIRDVCED